MIKKIVAVVFIVFSVFSICSKGFSNTVSYDFTFPENSSIFIDTLSWDCGIGEKIGLGIYLGLGESVRHFTDFGSNALVYGPAFSIGLRTQYEGGRHSMFLNGGIKAAYSQFPTVLWTNINLGYLYRVGNKIGLECRAGLLFWKHELSYEAGVGVRYFL